MKEIYIPNLVDGHALDFCKILNENDWEDDILFNFSNVSTCNPFPMLIVGSTIKHMRNKYPDIKCKATKMDNSYAQHMRFYRFIGIPIGKSMDLDYGNNIYQPITDLKIGKSLEISKREKIPLGKAVTQKACEIAKLITQGNDESLKMITFCIREMIRNIPEHSHSNEGFYCAQFWKSSRIVEVAIIDTGRGIRESFADNYFYSQQINNDYDALKLSLEPGISRTFSPDEEQEIFEGEANIWKNSGYGLDQVSQLCAFSGGRFTILSGNSAICVEEDSRSGELIKWNYNSYFSGTAIQMRMNIDKLNDFTYMKGKMKSSESKNDGFRHASKASNPFSDEYL